MKLKENEMSEGKEGIVAQITGKIKEAIEEAINKIDAKTIIDATAVAGFVIGALLIGVAIQYATAMAALPGIALIVLGIARIMHNSGAFKPVRY